jgi:L-ascorbate metabolism protein UlaG (beta-lactamase superfamily)
MTALNELLGRIRINAHSSVRVETGGRVLYIDPFRLEDSPGDADLIFFTHDHFDHLSAEDVARVSRADTRFVLPESCLESAAPVTAGRPVLALRPGGRGELLGVAFEAVPAYNPAKPFHPKDRGWVGYLLELEGLRLYVAGDTDATPEAAAVRCDLALLPIGGKYTMDPAEAAALANRIRPRAAVPFHYGSVAGSPADFERFAAAVDPELRVLKLV